ncbi:MULTISPECIES: DUF2835 family protein [unclassified Thioalkalivibrio]|uniref:DUF2835 family protein n=1 Tax=unclassified Thioalkalivibrio TaxID=2621013 RepID=UPI00037BF1B4|nr:MULTISPECIES: DUF2835 family protein [unclassified Thioalkalivibrio]
MRRYRVHLAISRHEMEDYYTGRAAVVYAESEGGVSVQFPARLLRKHLDQRGVYGVFELITDDQHRLLDFRRLEHR